MNTKAKTSFILIGTLLIGIVIGALGSGVLREERARKFDLMRPESRFLYYMKSVIRPTPEQSQQFDKILGKYSKQISTIHEQHQEDILALYDSLHTELTAILTEEQRTRLQESLEKGHNRRIAMVMEHLSEELSLSESQSKEIENILLANKVFPKRGRVFLKKRREFREDIRARFEKAQREIEAVLTPEQIQKYRQMRMHEPPFGPPEPRSPFPDGPPPQLPQ